VSKEEDSETELGDRIDEVLEGVRIEQTVRERERRRRSWRECLAMAYLPQL